MKLLDFYVINDFLTYLSGGATECKIVYDFYIKWLEKKGKRLEELTIDEFITDIDLVSSYFEVLNDVQIREENNNDKNDI